MPPLATDLRRQLENVVIQARDVAEAAAALGVAEARRGCRRAVPALRPRGEGAAQPAACAGPPGRRRPERGQDAIDRPTDPGAGLRILAPDALRPLPGREPPADAPRRRGRQPGGVRGTRPVRGPARPERLRPGGAVRQHDVAADLPHRRRAAGDRVRPGAPPGAGEAARQPAASRPSSPTTAWDGSTSSGRRRRRKRSTRAARRSTGASLPAVTQLFTEHYMVEFLLHNTIGAWWCAKEGILSRR